MQQSEPETAAGQAAAEAAIANPVAQVAAFDIFQEDAVEPVQAARVTHARAFRHVDDADQRVQGFDSHQFVILVHMIQPCDLFHSCSGLFDTKLVFFSSWYIEIMLR